MPSTYSYWPFSYQMPVIPKLDKYAFRSTSSASVSGACSMEKCCGITTSPTFFSISFFMHGRLGWFCHCSGCTQETTGCCLGGSIQCQVSTCDFVAGGDLTLMCAHDQIYTPGLKAEMFAAPNQPSSVPSASGVSSWVKSNARFIFGREHAT